MNLLITAFIIPSILLINLGNSQQEQSFNLASFINANMTVFNKSFPNCEKEKTYFTSVTKDLIVKSDGKEIGHLLVFDNNQGYITISNDMVVLDHNYSHGLDNLKECFASSLNYDGSNYYSEVGTLIHSKSPHLYGGNSIVDDFYWHADVSFTSQKVRTLEQDLDGSYSTRTDTSNAVFHNKTTWSTSQIDDQECGPLALANLLWTYKINNVVDLTMGAETSYDLAYSLRDYVNYSPTSGVYFSDILYGDNYFSSTGYYLDYTNVVNGISDTLSTTPLIGFYSHHNTGHFALVTGKGNSVYTVIFGIKFYTYWDITNTWDDRCNYNGEYLGCKFWVDNQYILWGFVLKDPLGNVVPLVTNS